MSVIIICGASDAAQPIDARLARQYIHSIREGMLRRAQFASEFADGISVKIYFSRSVQTPRIIIHLLCSQFKS